MVSLDIHHTSLSMNGKSSTVSRPSRSFLRQALGRALGRVEGL